MPIVTTCPADCTDCAAIARDARAALTYARAALVYTAQGADGDAASYADAAQSAAARAVKWAEVGGAYHAAGIRFAAAARGAAGSVALAPCFATSAATGATYADACSAILAASEAILGHAVAL